MTAIEFLFVIIVGIGLGLIIGRGLWYNVGAHP